MAGERLVEMYARLDLPTLQGDDVKEKLEELSYSAVLGGGIFPNLSRVTEALLPLWSTVTQFSFVFLHFAHEPEGPTLIAICLSCFLMLSYLYANTYSTGESDIHTHSAAAILLVLISSWAAFSAHVINRGYLRSRAVTELISEEKTQKEAISGGLLQPLHQGTHHTNYVSDRLPDVTNCYVEYRRSIKELGTVSIASPWTIFHQQPLDISSLLISIIYELPLVSQLLFCPSFSECLLDNLSVNCSTTARSFLSRFFGHISVFIVTKYAL